MAEHNLFLGGGHTTNPDYAMFPAASITATQAVDAATHKNAQLVAINRIVDLTADDATRFYFDNNPTADDANEIWNVGIIPQGAIVLGYYYEIINPVTGLTLTFRVKNINSAATTNIAAGVSAAAATSGYVNSGAGLVGLMPYNHYLQIVPTAVPVGGIADLRLNVMAICIIPFSGQW